MGHRQGETADGILGSVDMPVSGGETPAGNHPQMAFFQVLGIFRNDLIFFFDNFNFVEEVI